MDNSDIINDILKHVGGDAKNNLNELLRSFDDSEDEIKTFGYSPYIDIHNFDHNVLKGKFTILSMNIQSVFAKYDSLLSTLELLNNDDFQFSAICLQECWLDDGHNTNVLNIPSYQLVSKTQQCSGHGGLVIYLHEDFTYTERESSSSDIWECLTIDIHSENFDNKITLSNVYRPPRFNNCNSTVDKFISEFRPFLKKLSTEKSETIVTGDFNIDLLKITERAKYQEYYDMFVTLGFYPKLILPTRFSRKNATLIDQTFCKFTNKTQASRSGIFISGLSDHLPHFTGFDISIPSSKSPKLVKINRNDNASLQNFLVELNDNITKIDTPNDLTTDPSLAYDSLVNVITSCKEKHLKPKYVKFKKYKHRKSPWITTDIMKSMKLRDELYKKLKSTDPNSELYDTLETNFRTHRRILQKDINVAKKAYYFEHFQKFSDNARKTWNKINEILNKCKKKKDFPSYFMLNGRKIENTSEISDEFNNYFATIGEKLSAKIPINNNKSINSYLVKNIAFSFHFQLVTVEEVKKVISNLKTKHSAGHDQISTHLLKFISNVIAPILTLSINQSLCTGIVPKSLKIAKVIPLFKKDDAHIFDNYRPISLLPAMSKVFEKIVFIQVYDYFEKNKLLYASQYGFRSLHSTELAALEMSDIISRKMDRGEIPLSIFLDLSKAFDTLDHTILLKKLKYYGFNGVTLSWFKNYLSDRTQFIDFDGTQSSMLHLNTGVPQGSILGPLLFIIYMNDISAASNVFVGVLYADDSNLVSSLCSFDVPLRSNFDNNLLSNNITEEFSKVHEWL